MKMRFNKKQKLTTNEQKMKEMRDCINSISKQCMTSKESLEKIKAIINYKPPTTETEFCDDGELTENERFLLEMKKVKSKISSLWKHDYHGRGVQTSDFLINEE